MLAVTVLLEASGAGSVGAGSSSGSWLRATFGRSISGTATAAVPRRKNNSPPISRASNVRPPAIHAHKGIVLAASPAAASEAVVSGVEASGSGALVSKPGVLDPAVPAPEGGAVTAGDAAPEAALPALLGAPTGPVAGRVVGMAALGAEPAAPVASGDTVSLGFRTGVIVGAGVGRPLAGAVVGAACVGVGAGASVGITRGGKAAGPVSSAGPSTSGRGVGVLVGRVKPPGEDWATVGVGAPMPSAMSAHIIAALGADKIRKEETASMIFGVAGLFKMVVCTGALAIALYGGGRAARLQHTGAALPPHV